MSGHMGLNKKNKVKTLKAFNLQKDWMAMNAVYLH